MKNRSFPNPIYRYILTLEIIDFTDSAYVTVFNEDAEKILGKTAEEMNGLLNTNKDEYDKVFKDALFKEYIFTLRVKVRNKNMKIINSWNKILVWKEEYVQQFNELLLWIIIVKLII